ncbi:CUE domain-containing protein [Crossiella sp. CA-258035]|uniref:CUE domain-containing protein n=1 Tax=Crossiella sp. CA-258035 TaxID=2981138 RepID=UPI0024BD1A43|nr:CUE domain-containing protein [Crossiella sp. CA-258035]WHT22547.1 CUE domain-containing protein [Crossiella sp. CA-258035]
MKEAKLRRWLRAELNELDVHPPLNIDALCDALGRRRGREIRLMPFPLRVPGPYGLWIASDEADYVIYQSQTSRPHQDHIILHEIGHILHNHRSDDNDPDYLRAMMPELDPDMIQRALRRSHYDTEQEQQAELVATIILEWSSKASVASARASDWRLRQLDEGLGDQLGWS